MTKKLQVLIASSEVTPLAQTGGLADVAGSMPAALTRQGVGATIIMPAYQETLTNHRAKFENTGIKFTINQNGEKVTGSLLKGEQSPGVPAWLVAADSYYDRPGLYNSSKGEFPDNPERFSFFCKAVIKALPHLDNFPDIVLGNDWQTGLLMPYLAQMEESRPRGVFIIHNQGYLGLVPPEKWPLLELPNSYNTIDGVEYFEQTSLLKAGIVYSRAVVTVSPSYAKEIQAPEGGQGLDGTMRHYSGKLTGILNGMDCDIWNPETDPHIAANYNWKNPAGKQKCKSALLSEFNFPPSPAMPLIGLVGRLAAQKGLNLVAEAAEDIFRLGVGLIILGSGEPFYEEMCHTLATRFPTQCRVIAGYDNALAHRIIAGSDFMLLPSMYEPCGLVQMYALRYGTIPIVRAVGGLNDTIRDFAGNNPDGLWDTGFKFSQFQDRALVLAVRRAVELYSSPTDLKTMSTTGMKEDFSWDNSAKEYIELFKKVLTN